MTTPSLGEVGSVDQSLKAPAAPIKEARYTVISVDDHVVEPPNVFIDRVPRRFAERAPRMVEIEGAEKWSFEGQLLSQPGVLSMAGKRAEVAESGVARFAEMRAGCYDAAARVEDMDLNGVWASMSFPSNVAGFCGRIFSQIDDVELGVACARAWNDWIYEEWFTPFPDRIIPLGITCLADPLLGAQEIRRNAERGFRSVSLPERPQAIGFPSLFERYWDPLIEACVETETVVSLHVGSSGGYKGPPGSGRQLSATLFGQLSLAACAEWLWSGLPVRFPELKVAMSEGGIGWVAMLLDRLDNMVDRSGYGEGWPMRPSEVLQRNFWFCTLDDPATIDTRYRIGVENIMAEVDYPHADSTWPHTQAVLRESWGHLPVAELRAICSENAAKLYRHPLPAVVLPLDALDEGRP